MKKRSLKWWVLIFCGGMLCHCTSPKKDSADDGSSESKRSADEITQKPLFRKVGKERSGIAFVNKVEERFEYFENFSYAYNGGGTAIGDVNNDGLQDVFFTGNEVPDKLYLNKGNLKFEDITERAGITDNSGWNNGVAIVDINADGLLDLYICRGGWRDTPEQRKNLLYVNQGEKTFKESAAEYGLADTGYSTQASFFDFDNDNDLDVYLVNRPGEFTMPIAETLEGIANPPDDSRDKLFRNDNGTFIEVGKKMGITENFGYGLGVVTADINQDGYVDIYVSNDFDEHDYYYVNQGGKGFVESAKSDFNHVPLYAMGVDVMDINNDGLEDIYVTEMLPSERKRAKISMPSMDVEGFNYLLDQGFHYQYMHNMLQLNQGNNRFSEVSKLAGIEKTDWSWAGLASDFDNDGNKDLLVTNGYRRDIFDNDVGLRIREFFERNKSQFRSARELLEAKSKEIIELYRPIKERNYLFKNTGEIAFEEVSKAWGFEEESFSNGASVGDLDNDGDLDIVINNLEEEAFIFENKGVSDSTIDPGNIETDNGGNYLRIKLEGPKGNPFGLGAKIALNIDKTIQYQEFKMVRGYLSSQEPFVHFGLGASSEIDTLKVVWPDGKSQQIPNVQSNQVFTVRYDDSTVPDASKPLESLGPDKAPKLFATLDSDLGLDVRHQENEYNDFKLESLLPHRYSRFGPGMAKGDINGDGKDDLYICGAKGQKGSMFVQTEAGKFRPIKGPWDAVNASDGIAALFFDADGDGLQDLYVVRGGNELKEGDTGYRDKLFLNKGMSGFQDASDQLPKKAFSGSTVRAGDFDNDGDQDLFIGGRVTAQRYPQAASGHIYQNNKGVFKDVSNKIAPGLENLGLITDAKWLDYDGDNDLDLAVVGEWMPLTIFKNSEGRFEKMEAAVSGLENSEGWWYSVEAADFDQDGDLDLVAGNLGLNYKYHASPEKPFEVYGSDFDGNGSSDIILGIHENGKVYPLRGKECSSGQMPFLNRKYPSYGEFSDASVEDMVGEEALKDAVHYQAKTFATTYFENKGDGTFAPMTLPPLAQLSSVNDIQVDDFDKDGHLDMILAGNLYASEVETPRNDASFGAFLKGDGQGGFEAKYPYESGLYLGGDLKNMEIVEVNGEKIMVAAINDAPLQLVGIR